MYSKNRTPDGSSRVLPRGQYFQHNNAEPSAPCLARGAGHQQRNRRGRQAGPWQRRSDAKEALRQRHGNTWWVQGVGTLRAQPSASSHLPANGLEAEECCARIAPAHLKQLRETWADVDARARMG
jgi:hypothetical protein